MINRPKKGTLQYLMEKIPDIKPRHLAHAIKRAMRHNWLNPSDFTKQQGLRWACSHINAVKKGLN